MVDNFFQQPEQRVAPAERPDFTKTFVVDMAPSPPLQHDSPASISLGSTEEQYVTYKVRWFGLVVLTLLNIMVSCSVCSYAPKLGGPMSYQASDP